MWYARKKALIEPPDREGQLAQGTEIAGVQQGDTLAGKYRVDRILGVGGMGAVVAAHHIQLDEKVAIKFLLPEMLSNADAVGRFAREARAAVKIKSEHVARVTDVGTLDNGAPYMVMEFLEGGDLSAWLQQRGPLPVEQAVEFVLQACEAIAEAHGLGIVHRDLKPANLFCIRRPDGQLSIKVLDFGISKVTGVAGSGGDMSMTKTATVMGSPHYMSPEQMESSRDVDARTDIWALGVILYELLSGKVPFGGASLPEVCMAIALKSPPPLHNFRPDAPANIEQSILKCLEKDRQKRYRNVAELAHALVEFGPKRARASVERISGVLQAAGLSANALALPTSADATLDLGEGGTLASWGRTNPQKRGPSKKLLVCSGLALAAGLAIFVVTRKLPAPSSDTAVVALPSVAAVDTQANVRPLEVRAPSVPASDLAGPDDEPAAPPSAAAAVPKKLNAAPALKKPKPSMPAPAALAAAVTLPATALPPKVATTGQPLTSPKPNAFDDRK